MKTAEAHNAQLTGKIGLTNSGSFVIVRPPTYKRKLKLLFREHRGGFADSMDRIEQYPSVAEFLASRPSGLTVKFYADDPRIEADTFIVLSEDGPVGFCWYEVVPQ